MARQFLRSCTLSLTGSSSASISGGGDKDLTIEASIGASVMSTPNPARFRVYNPDQQLVAGFQNKEYQTLTYECGYQSTTGLVYAGNVKNSIYAHAENVADSYIDIFTSEHANAYQQARVGSTLAAGWTPRDKLNLALDAMKPFGITGLGLCNIDLDSVKYPRGRPFIGMAKDLLRQISHSAGADWHMHRGQVHIINQSQPVDNGGPVLINSSTGQVGWSAQTENGIVVRCLIRPDVYVNTQIKIDEQSVIQAERDISLTGESSISTQNLNNTGRIAADGLYRVAYFEVEASTRSQPWYMTLTCLAAGAGPNDSQIHSGLTSQFLA